MDRLKDEKFAEFYKKYLSVIYENYEFLETSRKKHLKKYCIWNIKSYKKSIKEALLSQLLEKIGNIKSIISTFPDYKLQESGLFREYTSQVFDDYFVGEYKGVKFDVAELNLFSLGKIYEGKSYEGYKDIFKGVVLNFKFNKLTNNTTILSSKKALTIRNKFLQQIFAESFCVFLSIIMIILFILLIGGVLLIVYYEKSIQTIGMLIGAIIVASCSLYNASIFIKGYSKNIKNIITANKDLKPVVLESSKFNKKFNVYSSDQVEARYLVTPLFMEKFYNLKTAFGAKNIRCSFFDDNLMIAIETKRDLFELGSLFKPIRDYKTIERFYDEITAIFDMIDYFKLNEDIYLK